MDVKEIWFAGFDEYPIFVTGTVSILAALLLAKLLFIYRTSSKIPIVNDRKLFDFSGTKACNEFALHSRQIFEKGLRDFPDKPFRVYTETGLMTILPFSLANEVRNDHRLSFAKHTEKVVNPVTNPSFSSRSVRSSILLYSIVSQHTYLVLSYADSLWK